MDQDIRDALSDIKTSVRDGFADINQRIDRLVTKGEFDAEVRRLDDQHKTLRNDFDGHEKRAETLSAESRKEMEKTIAGVRGEIHKELDGFRVTTRWAVGLSVTGVGALCTIGFALINTIQGAS